MIIIFCIFSHGHGTSALDRMKKHEALCERDLAIDESNKSVLE